MAAQYKLTYFNVEGRGEPIRLLFAASGTSYEDNRVELKFNDKGIPQPEPGAAWKSVAPFGQLPVLEVDGKGIAQQKAIERFLARRFGLMGSDEFDAAKCDMIIDQCEDVFMAFVGYFFAKATKGDDEAKAAQEKANKTWNATLDAFDKLCSDGGHFVGDKLSWPDIHFLSLVDSGKSFGTTTDFGPHPKLAKVIDNVKANEGVAGWLEKRPATKI